MNLWRIMAVTTVSWARPSGRIPIDLDDIRSTTRPAVKQVGAGWWRDAVLSTGTRIVHAWGLNLVVLTIRVMPPWGGEPLGLPVNVRLHRTGGQDLIELADEMVREFCSWFPDREFCARTAPTRRSPARAFRASTSPRACGAMPLSTSFLPHDERAARAPEEEGSPLADSGADGQGEGGMPRSYLLGEGQDTGAPRSRRGIVSHFGTCLRWTTSQRSGQLLLLRRERLIGHSSQRSLVRSLLGQARATRDQS